MSVSTDALAGTPYRTLAPVGAGGMAEVVEAVHVTLGRRVAVKLLHRRFESRADLVDRLRLEGCALGHLTHPNIVTAMDSGTTPVGRPYLVLERLHGRTFREELARRGAPPIAEAVDLVRQALAGLSAVHAAGLIHRDVKLDNLFVCDAAVGTRGGRRVKLLDFGVAKVVRQARGGPLPLMVPTDEGVSMGTPRFFSPEQASGDEVDARTDVYAMGMVLYALVAGCGPFDHLRAVSDVLNAHIAAPPEPPSRFAAQAIPAALEAAILKAIAKRPEDRFQSSEEFSEELARICAPPKRRAVEQASPRSPSSPTSEQAPRSRVMPLFLAVLAASMVVSAIGTALFSG